MTTGTAVMEIGPGIGALTEQLAKRAGKVAAVEVDRRLLEILQETMRDYPNVEIVHGDILDMDLHGWMARHCSGYSRICVVANLPYYITTPILVKLLEERLPVDSIVVMIQKEVADRIAAGPGTKDYGSLSILMQYYAEVETVCRVPRTVFMPKPHVDSAVIRLKIRKQPAVKLLEPSLFFKVVRASFSQRRKTIYNNLLSRLLGKEKKALLTEILAEAEIDPTDRAEVLTIDDFSRLSNIMHRRDIV